MKRIFLVFLIIIFAGCQSPVQTMPATQYGIKFKKLPSFLGGGISTKVAPPGEVAFIFPWESIYTITTAVREVSWGPGRMFPDYMNTRARDGNEVALAVSLRYQVSDTQEDLVDLVRGTITTDKGVEDLIVSVAQADIRHYLNELRTAEFIDPIARSEAIDQLKIEMQKRLEKYHIKIVSMSLDDFRFERALANGEKDDTYQKRLDEIQQLVQQTEREVSRKETVVALQQQKYNEVQAEVFRMLEEAKGAKIQATIRGDNYEKTKINESKGILAQGKGEVEGMLAKINALSGPGGRAMLKLDLAKGLQKEDPKFVVVNQPAGELSVNRTDTNELIKQMGVIEAVREPQKQEQQSAPSENLSKK